MVNFDETFVPLEIRFVRLIEILKGLSIIFNGVLFVTVPRTYISMLFENFYDIIIFDFPFYVIIIGRF
eukprot:TRINITY_DN4306_c0_g1_i1.p2 TRINITY_DN4306_c0_g1~~TRINITY_DN4306_c0_g1_i1.p2  ORF type:complete len:68 (-),score=3.10 TRINITY_DN4306_c0_g1_i1:549-752(-)